MHVEDRVNPVKSRTLSLRFIVLSRIFSWSLCSSRSKLAKHLHITQNARDWYLERTVLLDTVMSAACALV